jgi:hypothetical protein
MTSAEAFLWDRVIDPSVFGHMMTIGVFAIWLPKPL